jgi:hypothetical protein
MGVSRPLMLFACKQFSCRLAIEQQQTVDPGGFVSPLLGDNELYACHLRVSSVANLRHLN